MSWTILLPSSSGRPTRSTMTRPSTVSRTGRWRSSRLTCRTSTQANRWVSFRFRVRPKSEGSGPGQSSHFGLAQSNVLMLAVHRHTELVVLPVNPLLRRIYPNGGLRNLILINLWSAALFSVFVFPSLKPACAK